MASVQVHMLVSIQRYECVEQERAGEQKIT